VQDVIEGDFDQIEIYEQKLATLEHFVAEQAAKDVQAQSGANARCCPKRKTSTGCASFMRSAWPVT
jgi:hypothetical protein